MIIGVVRIPRDGKSPRDEAVERALASSKIYREVKGLLSKHYLNGDEGGGGIYMFDFDEAARMCGVLEGAPPFGLPNGAMPQVVDRINDWWIRLGLMENDIDSAKGIDCSLMGDLVEAGYRQSFTANPVN